MNAPIKFELAKLLKEKGFGMSDEDYIQLPQFYEQDGTYIEYDVHVGKKYNPNRTHLGADTLEDFEAHLTMMDNSLDDICLAPTIAEVVMWLYEKHRIWISVGGDTDYKFKFEIHKWSWYELEKCNRLGHIVLGDSFWDTSSTPFDSPTEAYLEAINYTLKNLIK